MTFFDRVLQIGNTFFGTFGDDTIEANDGNNKIFGLFGDDHIDAAGGDDKVFGGFGDDTVLGGDGEDDIRGGFGDDVLVGDKGSDTLSGGRGDDLLIWNNGDGSDLMAGGAGYDTVRVNGAVGDGDRFSISDNGDHVQFSRENLIPFQLDIRNTETLEVNGLSGDDVIDASGLSARLIDLEIKGGRGDDEIIGSDGADTLRGGAGDDTMTGGKGNDTFIGGRGDDLLIWNNGDGSDLMKGGRGEDTVQVNGAVDDGDDFRITGNGDRVEFARDNLIPFELDIRKVEKLDINAGGGNDVINAIGLDADLVALDLDGGDGNDLIIGGDGADVLRGGDGNDVAIGGKGSDTMLGEDGDDLLIWNNGDGSDLMEGGDGRDTVQVNGAVDDGDDFRITANGDRVEFARDNLIPFQLDIGTVENLDINGEGGDDVIDATGLAADLVSLDLDGGSGDDEIIGGDGEDVLRGGAGDDTMTGGKGNDVFLGEGGDDLMIWNNGDGSDLLEGGAGEDTVQINGAGGDGDRFSISDNGHRVEFARENLIPFELDIGTTEKLEVNGLGGDDVIDASGLEANLIALDLDGGGGNDLIIGGDGVDMLRGGKGFDSLTGGSGADVFIFASGDGTDVIRDFDDGLDLIGLEGGLEFADLTIMDDGGDTLISITATNEVLVRLEDVQVADIGINDFAIA